MGAATYPESLHLLELFLELGLILLLLFFEFDTDALLAAPRDVVDLSTGQRSLVVRLDGIRLVVAAAHMFQLEPQCVESINSFIAFLYMYAHVRVYISTHGLRQIHTHISRFMISFGCCDMTHRLRERVYIQQLLIPSIFPSFPLLHTSRKTEIHTHTHVHIHIYTSLFSSTCTFSITHIHTYLESSFNFQQLLPSVRHLSLPPLLPPL